MLHRDLDKLVKEESKTNAKMARIVKSTSGESSGSSRTKPSFSTRKYSSPTRSSTKRYSSPSRKSGKRGGGSSGGGSAKKKKFHNKDKTDPQKDDKGEDKPLTFVSAFAQGVFSWLALSMIANVGLSVAKAVSIAAFPIAGRIALLVCLGDHN